MPPFHKARLRRTNQVDELCQLLALTVVRLGWFAVRRRLIIKVSEPARLNVIPHFFLDEHRWQQEQSR